MMSEFISKSSDIGPYRITIGTRNDFEDGRIRIQPPINSSEECLGLLGSEHDIKIFDVLGGQEATLMAFVMNGESELSNEERIVRTVDTLLYELGHISSEQAFKDTY
jgi:hypothetical protein